MTRLTLLAAASLLPIAAAAQPPSAPTLGRLTPVAYTDIFAGCTADNVRGQPGVNYRDTLIEPNLAVDPRIPGRLLIGVQHDRWNNGGSRGLRGAISPDSGRSWFVTLPGGITPCTGGVFPRASDPWVSFGPDGIAYFSTLAFFNDTGPTTFGRTDITAHRSTDGGLTWGAPVALIDDRDTTASNDKNSILADPYRAGYAYSSWDRLTGLAVADDQQYTGASHAAAAIEGATRARIHAARSRAAAGLPPPALESFGPTYFSRTVNGGRTWQRAVPIFDPGPNAQTIANQPVVPPTGEVLNFFDVIDAGGNARIGFVRSADQGRFFGPLEIAAPIGGGAGAVSPQSKTVLRDGAILFSVAVDAKTGALYLAWEDTNVSADGQTEVVAFAQSLDDGRTWSTPIRINQTPAADAAHNQAFTPTIAVAADGTLAVTYFDFRNDTGTGGFEATDTFAAFCKPAGTLSASCATASNWGGEVRLTPASFNIANAPEAGGLFLGDYMGLAAQGQHVWAAFTTAVSKNRTVLWSREITLPAATTKLSAR